MSIKTIVLLLSLSAGCIIHSVEKTTTSELGTIESSSSHGRVGPLVLDARARSSTLTIHAARKRACTRNVYNLTEVRVGKKAAVDAPDLGGGGGGAGPLAVVYLGAFAVMAVTGAISGTVTAIELATDHDRVERHAVLSHVVRTECPVDSSGLAIDVTLPSGAVITGTTDGAGMMLVEIPDSEPSEGTATVRVGDKHTTVDYKRPADTRCSAARAAMFARINGEPDRARRAVLVRATPSCTTGDRDDALWNLTKSAAVAAIEKRCDTVRGMGHEIAELDPPYFHAVFAKHVEIAQCLRP